MNTSKGFDKPARTATSPLPPAAFAPSAAALPAVATGRALRPFTMDEVIDYGKAQSVSAASASAKINASARAGDIDEVGKALTALLTGADKYDVKSLKGGGVFGFFKRKKRELEAHYKTIDQQMQTLVADVEKQVTHFRMRVGDLQNLRVENHNRHTALGAAISDANERIAWMDANPPQVDLNDPMSANQLQAWNDTIAYARKRVDDLGRAQVMCQMIDAQIGMMIKNASALVMKFGEVKGTTLPQLQMGFSLYIANMEAEKGADYATALDDKNNEMMRANAEKLGVATVKTGTSMARSSIDLATLQFVKDKVFQTSDEMKRISDETAQRLQSESAEVARISQELADRYANAA